VRQGHPDRYDEDLWKYEAATGSSDGLDRSEETYSILAYFCDDATTKKLEKISKIHIEWVKPKGPWVPTIKLVGGTLTISVGIGTPNYGNSAPDSPLEAFLKKTL